MKMFLQQRLHKPRRAIPVLIAAIGLGCASTAASADAGMFVGITVSLDGKFASDSVGLTAKFVSTRREDRAIVGAGVSYYPYATGASRFGLDLCAGYQARSAGALLGYDFLRGRPVLGVGYVNTTPAPVAAPSAKPVPSPA